MPSVSAVLLQAEGNADEVSARDLEDFLQPFGNGRVVLKKVGQVVACSSAASTSVS